MRPLTMKNYKKPNLNLTFEIRFGQLQTFLRASWGTVRSMRRSGELWILVATYFDGIFWLYLVVLAQFIDVTELYPPGKGCSKRKYIYIKPINTY